jgi:hypothetical protein
MTATLKPDLVNVRAHQRGWPRPAVRKAPLADIEAYALAVAEADGHIDLAARLAELDTLADSAASRSDSYDAWDRARKLRIERVRVAANQHDRSGLLGQRVAAAVVGRQTVVLDEARALLVSAEDVWSAITALTRAGLEV